jgi:aminopeptidase N
MVENEQAPIMTAADYLPEQWFVHLGYSKPAAAFNVLRESILGRERFDVALRSFAREWQFKRPQPADFFRAMENASGTDLDWFWRGWFFATGAVDMSIGSVQESAPDGLPRGRHLYTVEVINHGRVVMPIILAVTYLDGSTSRLQIPAQVWRHDTRRAMKTLITDKQIAQVQLDPGGESFDATPDNNTWRSNQ